MTFANPQLCQRLYELTGKSAHWTWDCTGSETAFVRSNGVYGNGFWPAYMLRELYDMNPRATTWFKKETPRLGGMCSARTDALMHYIAHANTPEDAAAMLQIAVAQANRAARNVV
jgi:hypothetical protein